MNSMLKHISECKKTDKPWGYEELIEFTSTRNSRITNIINRITPINRVTRLSVKKCKHIFNANSSNPHYCIQDMFTSPFIGNIC